MKKMIKMVVIGWVGLAILMGFLWFGMLHFYDAAKNDMKAMVGKKVILESDTLMIIDYSMLNSTVTLSNGKEINFELSQKLKTVK